jgi:hypothetical protein
MSTISVAQAAGSAASSAPPGGTAKASRRRLDGRPGEQERGPGEEARGGGALHAVAPDETCHRSDDADTA